MNDQDLIVVYEAANSQEAHLLRGLLARRDIDAVVVNEGLQGALGGLQLETAVPSVAVAGPDVQKAGEVVIAFRRQQEIGPPQVDDVFPLEDGDAEVWPACPACGTPRATMCTTCGATGTDFPMADFQAGSIEPAVEPRAGSCHCGPSGGCEGAEGDVSDEDEVGQPVPVLLRCDGCDEVFQPRYFRVCTWCGHDFGSGLAAAAPPAEPLNSRTQLVLAGLGAGAFAVVVYLLYLMSR